MSTDETPITRLTAAMAYVLMLAQDGGSLFMGISTRDIARRGVAYQGRVRTISTVRLHGLINPNDDALTAKGAKLLSLFCDRGKHQKVKPAPSRLGTPVPGNNGVWANLRNKRDTDSRHVKEALAKIAQGPFPTQQLNPGVVDRIVKTHRGKIVELPSPYPSHFGKGKRIPYLAVPRYPN